jgi:drug/metabolite transporter (DMT)-like permease
VVRRVYSEEFRQDAVELCRATEDSTVPVGAGSRAHIGGRIGRQSEEEASENSLEAGFTGLFGGLAARSGRSAAVDPRRSSRSSDPVGGSTQVARYRSGVRVARPALGYAFTLAAAGLFAVNGTVSTLALEAGIAPTRLTALRCTGAALVLLAGLAVTAPGRLRVRAGELPLLAVFGVVGVALTQFLYYVAIGRLPVGIALVFEMTAPVFIALYVWLIRREPVRSRLWAALALSLSGLVLVAQVWQGGGSLDVVGVAAAFGAALCLATYYLVGERGTAGRDPVTLTCWSFVAAAMFWALAAPWWAFDAGVLAEPVPVSLGAVRLPLWVLVAWIVVLGAAAPFWLSIAALPHLAPTTAGLVATVEPVFASVVAWLWVEQVLTGWQVAGGAVVLTGIALAQTARSARSVPPLPESPAPLGS